MASAAKVADCSAKKIPSRVMGSTAPAASPTRYHPGPAIANRSKSPAVNEGIGHEYGSRLAPAADARALDPGSGAGTQRGRRDTCIRRCADADRQMIGPRERPDVAWRIGHELQQDLVAGGAVNEEAGCDRQLAARKRARQPAPHQAVRAVGADDHRRAERLPVGRVDFKSSRHATDVGRARGDELRACAARGVQEETIERGAIGHHERGRSGVARQIDGGRVVRRAVDESRAADGDGRHGPRQRAGDERERASRDAAAARLLTRMRRIEQKHAGPAPRQQIRGPRAARSGADDRDVAIIAPRGRTLASRLYSVLDYAHARGRDGAVHGRCVSGCGLGSERYRGAEERRIAG